MTKKTGRLRGDGGRHKFASSRITDDDNVPVRKPSLCRTQGFAEIVTVANTQEDQDLLTEAAYGGGHVVNA
jgi:hypothetical protein